MDWIKLLQTWSHERLALVLGFSDQRSLELELATKMRRFPAGKYQATLLPRQRLCHP